MHLTQQRTMSRKKIFQKIWQRAFNLARGKYYAQYAEDIIIKKWLNTFYPKQQYFYIDIGCAKSRYSSNTWILYKEGASGYCYDANPIACKKFKRKRSRDVVINSAVTTIEQEEVKFFILNSPELSTIHRENVEAMIAQGFKVKNTVLVPSTTIEKLLGAINKTEIDLLNLDIEGDEFEILKDIDLQRYHIKVICIEVVDYKTGRNNQQTPELIRYLKDNGYSVICNTGVNIVFAINGF